MVGASELGVPRCWTRGGLTVTALADEFSDPLWAPRGQYRALLQFIMNWNNWPSRADREAMLDGPPPADMPEEQRARIAAVVSCLCERDGLAVPGWTRGVKARRRGGVLLVNDDYLRNRLGWADAWCRSIRRGTPGAAQRHRVWFEAETLHKR